MTVEECVRKLYKIQNPEYSEEELKACIKDWKQRGKILLRWLNNFSKKSYILDCGCGVGIAGAILKEKGFRNIIGIEINDINLNAAKTVMKVYKMNCENIKFESNSFDVILALNIIEHLNRPDLFLQKIKKILKPNGIIIFSLPNEIWFRKILGLIPKDEEHKHSWNIFSFKKFLKENNLKVLEMKPIGRIPFLIACQTFMVLSQKF